MLATKRMAIERERERAEQSGLAYGRHTEAEVEKKEKLELHGVHLSAGHAANLGIVYIVIIAIVKELCSHHHAGKRERERGEEREGEG